MGEIGGNEAHLTRSTYVRNATPPQPRSDRDARRAVRIGSELKPYRLRSLRSCCEREKKAFRSFSTQVIEVQDLRIRARCYPEQLDPANFAHPDIGQIYITRPRSNRREEEEEQRKRTDVMKSLQQQAKFKS